MSTTKSLVVRLHVELGDGWKVLSTWIDEWRNPRLSRMHSTYRRRHR